LKQNRVWWLVTLLLLLINIAIWQRPVIARWLAKIAVRKAGEDQAAAAKYVQLSSIVWRQTPEAALANARMARRANDSSLFAKEMQRAHFLGIDPEVLEREQILSLAQSGKMSLVGDKLAGLVSAPGGDETQICEAYALGYSRLREFAKALALLEAWANDHPKDARPWAWMGKIHVELQASERAEAAFRKSLSLNPNNAIAAQGLGTLLVDLKRPTEAIGYFPIALEDAQVGAEAAVGLASTLRVLSQLDKSEQVLQAAVSRFPDDHRVQVALADAFVEKGAYQQAVDLLKTHIDASSTRREIRYSYATALRGLGRSEEAAAHFQYALESANKTNQANLLIPQAAEDKDNFELRYQIGEANLRWGNIEDGQLWLQSVLEINPSHGPTHLALAEFYRQQSQTNPKFILQAQRHALQARVAGYPKAGDLDQQGKPN
jgi:tetratricopeptide (TPR) repeat protein